MVADKLTRPRRGAVTLLLVTALTATACGATPAPARPGLAVVAGENVWGNIAAQIGGEHVTVTSLITDPNRDPHSYEAAPTNVAAVGLAALVIENGLGYDTFLDRMIDLFSSNRPDVLSIATAARVGGDNPNPHLWYDPTYVMSGARAIETRLAAHDPAHAAVFAANLKGFLSAYQPYVTTLASIRTKYRGEPVAYTERVPGYLISTAGLKLATPTSFAQSIEDGNEPAPGDTAAINSALTAKRVRLLFYNAQVTTPVTQKLRDLAIAEHIPVVGVSETIPSGEKDFGSWQADQARAVLAALGG